jgi:hypothetical protein
MPPPQLLGGGGGGNVQNPRKWTVGNILQWKFSKWIVGFGLVCLDAKLGHSIQNVQYAVMGLQKVIVIGC